MESHKGRTMLESEAYANKKLGTTNFYKEGLQKPKKKPIMKIWEQ